MYITVTVAFIRGALALKRNERLYDATTAFSAYGLLKSQQAPKQPSAASSSQPLHQQLQRHLLIKLIY